MGTRRLLACLAPPGSWTSLREHRGAFPSLPPVRRRPAEQVISAIESAGLKGRGGAGFPTAKKMRAVASGKRRPMVLANGSEGGPASRKDELLMSSAPHPVLDWG